jgi:MFS family permease
VSNLTPKAEQGTALGLLASGQNLAAMLASFLAGYIWYEFGAVYVFLLAAAAAVVSAIYLGLMVREKEV